MSLNQSLIPTLSVDNAVDILSSTYISAIQTGTPFKSVPSVMLWGPPGVGKSQAIVQIANKIQASPFDRRASYSASAQAAQPSSLGCPPYFAR